MVTLSHLMLPVSTLEKQISFVVAGLRSVEKPLKDAGREAHKPSKAGASLESWR